MTRIDRYVLTAFLRDYATSLVILIGLFAVMDSVFNYDEFVPDGEERSALEALRAAVSYYFFQSFFVYAQLAGVVAVLASTFTFMRMSRNNELVALLAAGVPLWRVAMPAILAAVAINAVVLPVNQELLIPSLVPRIARDRADAAGGVSSGFAVRAMPDGRGGIFDAAVYHPATAESGPWAESVTTVLTGDVGSVSQTVVAARADWDAAAGLWRLTDGSRIDGLDAPPSLASETAPAAEPADVLNGLVTPAEIELFHSANVGAGLGGSYFDLLSTRQLDALLARPRVYGAADLLRAKHTRLASLVMNVVLVLLAVPCVLTRQPGQLARAATKTLLLIGGALGLVFLCQLLSRDPPTAALAARWPAWMSWTPVLILGPLAVVLLERMET